MFSFVRQNSCSGQDPMEHSVVYAGGNSPDEGGPERLARHAIGGRPDHDRFEEENSVQTPNVHLRKDISGFGDDPRAVGVLVFRPGAVFLSRGANSLPHQGENFRGKT